MNTNIKTMLLDENQFESLKFLTGINYHVDNITVEIEPSVWFLKDFLGKYIKQLKGYRLVRFVNQNNK